MSEPIPDEVLRAIAWHGIKPPIKPGSKKTTCPKCSASRENNGNRCLSIYPRRGSYVKVKCHHCEWEAAIKI